MDRALLLYGCIAATGFFLGAAAMALYYRPQLYKLEGRLNAAVRYANAWRENACSIAHDLAEMRKRVPQRDPRTNRFVKRMEAAQ